MRNAVPLAGRTLTRLTVPSLFVVAFILSGSSLATALLVTVAVSIQILIGRSLLRIFDPSIGEDPLLYNVIGFAVGFAFTGVSEVMFHGTPIATVGWLVPAIPGVIANLWLGKRRKSRTIVAHVDPLEFTLVFGITLVVLGATYGWQLPLGLGVLLGFVSLRPILGAQTSNRPKWWQLLVSLSVVVGLFSVGVMQLLRRDVLWWTINSDITFTEGASSSIGGWGLTDHIAAAGQNSLTTYHWIPFAWNGLITRVSGAETWLVSTRLAHIVIVLSSVALIWWIIRHFLKSSILRSVVATTIGALIALSVGKNFTLMVGTLWLLAIGCYLVGRRSDRRLVSEMLVVFTLTTTLFMTKPQLALVIVGGVAIVASTAILHQRRLVLRWIGLATTSVMSGLSVLLIQRLLSGSDSSGNAGLRPDVVSVGSFNELGNIRNVFALPLSLTIAGGLLILPIALILLLLHLDVARQIVIAATAIVVSATSVLYLVDAIYSFMAIYMIAAIAVATGVLLAAVIARAEVDLPLVKNWVLPSGLVLFSSWALNRWWFGLFNPQPTGSLRDITLRKIADAPWIPVLFAAFLIWFLWAFRSRSQRSSLLPLGMLVVLGVLNPVSGIDGGVNQLVNGVDIERSDLEQFYAFSEDLAPLIRYAHEFIDKDDVVGSNAFCPYDANALCSDPNWWNRFVESNISSSETSRCHGLDHYANDWSLPAVLDRRFFIQGPHMFISCGDVPEWLTSRVMTSEEFARRAGALSFKKLCNDNVDWFIIDRSTTTRESWEPYGEVVAQTNRLQLLKMNDQLCAT